MSTVKSIHTPSSVHRDALLAIRRRLNEVDERACETGEYPDTGQLIAELQELVWKGLGVNQ